MSSKIKRSRSSDNTADDVGKGWARSTASPTPAPAVETVPLDAPAEWLDHPQIEGQLKQPGMFKPHERNVMVFDFSKSNELSDYNKLHTKCLSPFTNTVIMGEEMQFVERTQNWKTLVKTQTYKFKKIIKQEKKT